MPSCVQAAQKVIYISYADKEEIPERVFNGSYFSVTVKTLSTIQQHEKLKYSFSKGRGVTLQNREPEREKHASYVLDTFYFLATSNKIILPTITASIDQHQASLKGVAIEGVTLNPDMKFSKLLADDFTVLNVHAKKYDNKSNIVTFEANVKHGNIEVFHLDFANEQGFERSVSDINRSSMTYYAVIPKKYDTLTFTYFNLLKERYIKIKIPVEIIDDSVSTQSDLKPTENKNYLIKIGLAAIIIVIGLALLIVYKQWWMIIIVIVPGVYIAMQAAPAEQICVRSGSPLYLLPIENATVFDKLTTQGEFEVKHSIEGYKQITHNNKIGWISEDDICTH